MHSSHARLRRSIPLLALLGCVAVTLGAATSCADDEARIGSGALEPPARTAVPSAPEAPSAARLPEPPAIDVAGRVADDGDTPVVGRSITLVDRRGKRQEVLTDEEGGFYVRGVATPYDVLVDAAPSGAVITPLVFLGLQRAQPRLEVFERHGTTQRPPSQPLRVGVKLPPCRAAGGSCWVSVVSASASGGGATAISYTAATETALLELEHAWREKTLRPSESLQVHVLAGDAEYTQYAYTRLMQVAARPGESTDLGMLLAAPVPSTEPVTMTGHTEGLPEGWQWTLSSQLELPGGAEMSLRYDWLPSSSMRLPVLAGATWHVGAWVQHPPTPERPYFHRSSQAWSGTLPLTTTNIALDVPTAPEVIRPAMEGTFSRRALGLAWDGHAPALASVVLSDLRRGKQRFRAFTAAPEISLARLEALGLPRLEPGEHVIDLATTPGATVDELTEPDPVQRRDRFDVHVSGGTTYQRFRFVVTQ
jgi:hypothetical protein